MYTLSKGILPILAVFPNFNIFAYSGNTLKASIFCIFWQCFGRFNILHILTILESFDFFSFSGSALKASTIWVQKNPSVARDLCPCEINFHILAAAHLPFLYSTLLKSILLFSYELFFLNSTPLYILLALLQTSAFCAIFEEQSAVKQCDWG